MADSVLNLLITLKDEASAGLGELSGSLLSIGGVATAGVVGGLAAIGGTAFSVASDLQNATNQMQAQLGLTGDAAAQLGDVALDVFGNNFGASVGDAAAAVGELEQRLGLMGTEGAAALQSAAESAFALQDVFGVDVAESAAAAQTLMNEFGISSAQAFDMLAGGFQQGLNGSDDFLDTIGEYSNLFADGGASADQFFSALQTGMAGGVLGTDKAADAFKEFGIRILDGSTATRDAMAALGLGDVLTGISDGSVTAADAFSLVQGKLREIDDPALQAQLGVALLGTQFEDLGASAALGIDLAATNLGTLAGSADSLNVKYADFGSFFGGIWREALVAIQPLGAALLDLANASLPFIQAGFEAVQPLIAGFAQGLAGAATALGEVGAALAAGDFAAVGDALAGMFEAIDPGALAGQAAGLITGFIGQVVAAAPGAMAQVGQIVGQIGSALAANAPAAAAGVGGMLAGIVGAIGAGIPQIIAAAQPYALAFAQWAIDAAPGLLANVGSMLGQLLGAIGAALPGIVEAVAGWAAAFIELGIQAAPGLLASLLGLLGQLNGWIMAQAPGIAAQLAQWAISFIQWVAPTAANLIVALGQMAGQLFGFVASQAPTIISTVAAWALAMSGWVLTEALPALLGALGTLMGDVLGYIGGQVGAVVGQAKALGKGLVDGVVSAISGAPGVVRDALLGIIKSGVDAVKAFFGIQSPSRVTAAEIGTPIAQGVAIGITGGMGEVSAAMGQMGGAVLDAGATVAGAFGDTMGAGVRAGAEAFGRAGGSLVARAKSLGERATGELSGALQSGGVEDAANGWTDQIAGAMETAAGQAKGLGREVSAGIAQGISAGAAAVASAARSVAGAAVSASKDALAIQSPSRVFAEQVGQPITAGMAEGILSNMQVLLDAAKEISWAVLDEAKEFAGTIEDAIGPLLAAAYQGAADFARGQIGALDIIEALAPDTRALDKANKEFQDAWKAMDDAAAEVARFDSTIAEVEAERARLEAVLAAPLELDDKAAAEVARLAGRRQAIQARLASPAISEDQREKLLGELDELDMKEEGIRDSARERTAEELAKVTEELTTLQEERAAAEAEYNASKAGLEADRQAALERYKAAERAYQEQQQIQADAKAALQEAQKQALTLTDPAERAAFLDVRAKQIAEEAELRQQIAASTTEYERRLQDELAAATDEQTRNAIKARLETEKSAEKQLLEERLALLQQASAAEFGLYQTEARERQAAQAQALRDAQDAIKQLGNLVFFTQADVFGKGQDIIKGIAGGMLDQARLLQSTLGDVLEQALAEAKKRLGIASPSKVAAAEIGAPFIQGISGAVLAGQQTLSDASARAVEGLLVTPPELQPRTLPALMPQGPVAPGAGLPLGLPLAGGGEAGMVINFHAGAIVLNGAPAPAAFRREIEQMTERALREAGRKAQTTRDLRGQ